MMISGRSLVGPLKDAEISDYSIHLDGERGVLFGVLWRRKNHTMAALFERDRAETSESAGRCKAGPIRTVNRRFGLIGTANLEQETATWAPVPYLILSGADRMHYSFRSSSASRSVAAFPTGSSGARSAACRSHCRANSR